MKPEHRLNLLGTGAGFGVGLIWGCDTGDRFTLAVEFAVRNVGIATVIAISILGRVEFAVFATAFFLIEVPTILAAVVAFRFMHDRPRGSMARVVRMETEPEIPPRRRQA